MHFKEVVLTSRKAGEGQKDFLKVTMKEVFITSVQPSGARGGDDRRERRDELWLASTSPTSRRTTRARLTGEVKFGWNVKTTEIT